MKAKADKVVNQVLTTSWGDSFSNSKQEGDTSMIVMEDKISVFDSLFALMEDTDTEKDKSVSLLESRKI